jgi:hypothetical protein
MTYLPTANLSPLYTFTAFSSTVSAFATALGTAFPGFSIQAIADTTAGKTSNALVIINDSIVMSVAPGNFLGYNLGVWQQWTAAQMAGGVGSLFTQYP